MKDDKYFSPVTFLLIRDEALNLWDEIAKDLEEFELHRKENPVLPIGSLGSIQKIQFRIVTALHYTGMILNMYERLKSLMKSNESFDSFISQHSRADGKTVKILFAVDRVNNIQKHLLMADIKEKNDAFVAVAKVNAKFYWVRDSVCDVSSVKGKTRKQIENYVLLFSQKEISLTIPQITKAIMGVGIPRMPANRLRASFVYCKKSLVNKFGANYQIKNYPKRVFIRGLRFNMQDTNSGN